jgi:hypothetical protein
LSSLERKAEGNLARGSKNVLKGSLTWVVVRDITQRIPGIKLSSGNEHLLSYECGDGPAIPTPQPFFPESARVLDPSSVDFGSGGRLRAGLRPAYAAQTQIRANDHIDRSGKDAGRASLLF